MHCHRSSSGCSGMQGISARLTGKDLCWITLCYANIFGVTVCKASATQLTGEDLSIALCYANIFGVAVFNASMLN